MDEEEAEVDEEEVKVDEEEVEVDEGGEEDNGEEDNDETIAPSSPGHHPVSSISPYT